LRTMSLFHSPMQEAETKYICSDGGIELAEYVAVTLIFPKVVLHLLVLLAKRWRFHYEKDW